MDAAPALGWHLHGSESRDHVVLTLEARRTDLAGLVREVAMLSQPLSEKHRIAVSARVCRTLVELHGSELSAEYPIGGGRRLRVRLPG